MAAMPRLNTVIRALENGGIPVTVFAPPTVESAVALSVAPYDGIIFEAEHNAYDIKDLRDCLQYLLNRKQIVEQGTLPPVVTPLIRVPPNGAEMNQWCAKQVLDIGAYGVVWPHISTAAQPSTPPAPCRHPPPTPAH